MPLSAPSVVPHAKMAFAVAPRYDWIVVEVVLHIRGALAHHVEMGLHSHDNLATTRDHLWQGDWRAYA